MITATGVRVGLFFAGIITWAFGLALGYPQLRWVGLGLLIVAFLARFYRPPSGAGKPQH